jgi:hypothetical protein
MKHLWTFILIIPMVAQDCLAQSIAEAARQERERQKAAQSKVVITSNVKISSAPPSVSTSAAAQTASPALAKPVEITDNKGRNEKYWRSAFQQARDELKRAEGRVQLLDLRLKDLNTQLLLHTEIYNREYRLGPEITAAQKELDEARKEVEEAGKKIAGLEEELRRSGGLPGWAR